jgi:tetratricopeptide (TPR) repeat protein
MKYPLILGCTVALVAFADLTCSAVARAKTFSEVKSIAQAATVEIKLSDSVGSGVIIHRQGDIYTLVTNRHVVCGNTRCTKTPAGERYMLGLADGQQYRVQGNAIKLAGNGLDLAIIHFYSKRNYPVVSVAALGSLKVDDVVYTAGFPYAQPGFYFDEGQAIAVVNKRLIGDRGGYSIIYNANTLPGMSGGGVFNSNGQLVAIHGLGDRYAVGTDIDDDYKVGSKVGFNRGIPVRWLIQTLGELGLDLGGSSLPPTNQGVATDASTADEYFIAGFNKFVDPGDNVLAGKRQAIQEFSKAIRLNPKYTSSYFMRAYVYNQVQDLQPAVSDYNQVLLLDPQNANAYNNRGNLKKELKDFRGSLADYNQALLLVPSDAKTYSNRGLIKEKLKDLVGAMADLDRAVALAPKDTELYSNRGTLKRDLKDVSGALADFNQSIALNPKYTLAYNNRGLLKAEQLKDFTGAMADYNQAIELNPRYPNAYFNRGLLKKQLKDLQGALADYNQTLVLDPKFARAYASRGLLRAEELKDMVGAMADYNQALVLDSEDAKTYFNRGNLKDEQNDVNGAIADYSRAIDLNQIEAYVSRGIVKANKLRDFNGALADYNQAIAIDPQYAYAYGNRGILKYQQNDRAAGIADLRRAVILYRAQGQTERLQQMLTILKAFGGNE